MAKLEVESAVREGPLHSHYVSRHNDGIYPALSSPLGYEDEHPEDYRPATAREVQKYKGGQESVTTRSLPVPGAEPTTSPTSITLMPADADADPEALDEVGPPTVEAAVVEVAPAVVLPAPAPAKK